MTPEEKEKLINKIPFWWHTIDLGDNIITPGKISPQIHQIIMSSIPDDLSGKSVLDIGCWDGYYAFECEKRGAEVVAIDYFPHKSHYNGFHTAKDILNSSVEFHELDLFNLPMRFNRQFDIVLLFGVIYHVKHPLLALEIVKAFVKDILVVESHCIKTDDDIPIMQFYPEAELNNDRSNWWGPNVQCLIDMLKTVNFSNVELFKTYYEGSKNLRAIIKAC